METLDKLATPDRRVVLAAMLPKAKASAQNSHNANARLSLDHLAHLDQKDPMALAEKMAAPAATDAQDHKDQLDHQAQMATSAAPDPKDPLELPVCSALLPQPPLDNLAHKVVLANLVLLVKMVAQATMDAPELQVPLATKDLVDNPVVPETLVLPVALANLVPQEAAITAQLPVLLPDIKLFLPSLLVLFPFANSVFLFFVRKSFLKNYLKDNHSNYNKNHLTIAMFV
jgi:hypothetical protein